MTDNSNDILFNLWLDFKIKHDPEFMTDRTPESLNEEYVEEIKKTMVVSPKRNYNSKKKRK